ncbi:sulfide:quinone reductase, partial [Ferrimicrobium acidiphilum]
RSLGPERAEITLIAKDSEFRFVPSFPWVATGRRRLEQISFSLAGPLASRQVRFANETVTHIDTAAKVVTTSVGEHAYDFLVIATGHRSANEAVPGLGP